MHTPTPPPRTRKRSLRRLRTPRSTQTSPRGEAPWGRVGPTGAAAHAQPGPRPSNNRLTERRRPARRQKRRARPAAGEAAAPPGALGLYAEAAKTHEPRESRLPAGSRRASTRCPRFQEALGSVTSILCSGPGLRHLFSINRATAANPGLRTARRPRRFRPPARPLIPAHAAGRAHATRRPVPDCFPRALTAGSRGPPRGRTNRSPRAEEGWARFSGLLPNTRPPPSPVNTLQSLSLRGNDLFALAAKGQSLGQNGSLLRAITTPESERGKKSLRLLSVNSDNVNEDTIGTENEEKLLRLKVLYFTL
ncbi:synapsin-1-like [Balaenoptera ricei]|uniref:synapsin-1-like n=1 Tax=Balaenoptera ricei TaxID=2746895 RepID=UPI0028BF0FBF|nr:synapsin-1-like [Balaenoptera ricei]